MFYADVSKSVTPPPSIPKAFNTESTDHPLRGYNYTQDTGTDWRTPLTGVNAGDELRFNVYYHNASSETANNTKIELNIPQGSSSSFTANSKISANGFNDCTSSLNISLTSSQSITLKNKAKWYHSHDGNDYQVEDVTITISGNTATINLGQVHPGYTPNDGYVVFYADVSKKTTPTPPTSGGGGGGGSIIYYGGETEIEILNVTENNNGTLKLNGRIKKCEKENCEAKFLWGENEKTLTSSTETIKNLKTNDEFSYTLKDLKKGKPYFIQIEAKMETKTVKSDIIKVITKPDKPKSFKTTLLESNNIQIDWKKGDGATKILIKRGVDLCPEFNDEKAPIIYFGDQEKIIDDTISSETGYCYRAWMVVSDGLDLIFSDSMSSSIATKKIIEKEEKPKEPVITPEKENEVTEKPATPFYKLSLKTLARNTSSSKLEWKNTVNATADDILEFNIEIENNGNSTLYNLIILNQIRELEEIQNVVINNIGYSSKILDRAFIKELKQGEKIQITFSGKLGKAKEITLLSEAYTNQTKSITDVVKITKIEENNFHHASLFDTFLKEQFKSWLILVLIIIILYLIYLCNKEKQKNQD